MDDILQAFLGAETEIEDEVYIKRLNINLRIKGITEKVLTELREQSTHFVGKGTKRERRFDEEAFNGLLISFACVNFDFGNPKMLEKYGAIDASDCVQKALLAGEVQKLQEAILRLSGFTDDDQEAVDEIKN